MRCEAEMCRNWTGSGCVCEMFDIEPDVVDEDEQESRWD